jgi:hypothetical protein
MKSIILSLSLLSLMACEAPSRTRTGVLSNPASSTQTPSTTSGVNSGSNPWTSGETTTGQNSGSSSNTLPAGFETCDISQKYFASGINYIGICQSKLNETQIIANPSVTNTSVRTCLIPTYKTGNGASTYLGQPQCFYPTANQITAGSLVKSRNGFTNNPITGAMVMLETSTTAYFTCMNSYVNFVNTYCPANPSACSNQASQHMNSVCNDFKSRHSYVDLCLNTAYCSNN